MTESNAVNIESFVSRCNPVSGCLEWEPLEIYDYTQEVARSGFADMLHDEKRNQRYFEGIRAAIKQLRTRGESSVRVLDIGTGSGLLAMMAASAGADEVTACEAFGPVAECAQRVLKRNGWSEKIRLIKKHSTELTVGENGDLTQRANLLVAEVFDTELIGEGALRTYRHAAHHLMTADAISVPCAARIWLLPVESQWLWSHHRLSQLEPRRLGICVPEFVQACSGSASIHELQLSELRDVFKVLTDKPVVAKRFDFLPTASTLALRSSSELDEAAVTTCSGTLHACLFWWDLQMEHSGEVWLTCAPTWAQNSAADVCSWRDHWMQAVIYLSGEPRHVQNEEALPLRLCHDEFRFWIEVCNEDSGAHNRQALSVAPVCTCGFHVALSGSRLARLQDSCYQERLLSCIETVARRHKHDFKQGGRVVCISETGLLPFLVLHAIREELHLDKSVIIECVETNTLSRRCLERLLLQNASTQSPHVIRVFDTEDEYVTSVKHTEEEVECPVLMMVAEPYSLTGNLPWHYLSFWYMARRLVRRNVLFRKALLAPNHMSVHCIALEFEHLWKIRAPVKSAEGFNLSAFDEMVQPAIEETDGIIESQTLWEYPSLALTDTHKLMDLSLGLEEDEKSYVEGLLELNIAHAGHLNGLAFWCQWSYQSSDGDIHWPESGGITEPLIAGAKPRWDRLSKQAVRLFPVPRAVGNGERLLLKWRFDFALCELQIDLTKHTTCD